MFRMAFTIAFGAAITNPWQIRQHLLQAHAFLPLQPRRGFAFDFSSLAAATSWWSHFLSFLHFLGRPLPSCNRGSVPRNVTHQTRLLVLLDQDCMHSLGQLVIRKFREGPRKGSLTRHCRPPLPAT